jgi:molybdopterin/thiamine biosynthesis adenylyltransferase
MSLGPTKLSYERFMRYSRHLLMDDIGEAGQAKLINARVLIVGLGGLGCPVALYLAAAGIGELSFCDPDKESSVLKMALPCCEATTRRVVKNLPSRIASTSKRMGMLGSPGRRK